MYLRVFLYEELLLFSSYCMIQIETKKDKWKILVMFTKKQSPLLNAKVYIKNHNPEKQSV